MKELIIDLSDLNINYQLNLIKKIINYLYMVADQCEKDNTVIDAQGIRNIALNIISGVDIYVR